MAIAVKTAPKGFTQKYAGPIVGTGAQTANRLLNDMPKRTSGVVCVTDQRMLFFGITAFSKVKKMWWGVPRNEVGGVEPGDLLFAVRFTDGSMAWFGGNRNDYEAIASALDQTV